eukprot:12324562-Alexandrium_andersonii.AAC.1
MCSARPAPSEQPLWRRSSSSVGSSSGHGVRHGRPAPMNKCCVPITMARGRPAVASRTACRVARPLAL